ncbi:cilia- and flagella-associated protein 44 [Scyliorhinus canicula]|uniref:cilia- and flagella-associated protein 44 n=1 Tax=Scyliorhinus canicula TaxID=7830 RepID=UPI0018F2B4D1|nr:cilia- and flagella-associated protein 44 [Scyliorhinus canicula]
MVLEDYVLCDCCNILDFLLFLFVKITREKDDDPANETQVSDDFDFDLQDENYEQEAGTADPTEEGVEAAEEQEEGADQEQSRKQLEKVLSDTFFYEYEDVYSKPFITPDSEIPEDLLTFSYSFGYDCTRRVNIQLIDEQTILFVAGNLVILMDIKTKEQRNVRSSTGGSIGIVMVHPSGNYFAVGEKGTNPNIIIYEYPSLKPYRIMRGGTEQSYAFADFNASGNLLASVGGYPDYMLTIWNWKQEKIVLRSKAFSQDVYRVTFSPENDEQLTTSGTGHIRFWKMVETFTGLKLQGELGRFGRTALTDIDGYVELPDGKVVSGSEWGNMLLWDGGLIKVELCRRDGKPCHHGPINQFVLDEGELITVGADGCVRVWDFETIDTAESYDEDSQIEMEPMNELNVGRNVNLQFMVKFKDSNFIWCAQDASGRIWKLDLSFSNITQDPECMFSFHAGAIQAMDLSPLTYLMATTALDRTVRIYDFVRNKTMAIVKYSQGGTALVWAPLALYPKGNMIVAGFEDGVIRILEIYNPQDLAHVAGRSEVGEVEIRLKQAMKPHTAGVTAIAYDYNGEMFATGSKDNTVFFFLTGNTYAPVGYINVPGPVVSLEWSPPTHETTTLLIFCENGYVVQTAYPELEDLDTTLTFEIPIPKKYFRFKSIRSSIERNAEISRRQKIKDQKEKEKQERLQEKKEMAEENPELATEEEEEDEEEEEEEEEEPLPMIYIPPEPNAILCGFYSEPGEFWLSVAGYDGGYLYHCKFTEQRFNEDEPIKMKEPFAFLAVEDASENPIRQMAFNSEGNLLFCGMDNGAVRIYPLSFNDYDLKSMQIYWSLSIHDNDNGHIKRICISYDDQFLVTCGADGNIFAFSILPQEDIAELMRGRQARVPSPRRDLATDKIADDIDDPNAYSLENAKKKAEMDLIMKLAEEKKAKKRHELHDLQDVFRELQSKNAELPEHVQLKKEDFELDHQIRKEVERQIADRIKLVYKEMAWEQEKYHIGLQKLQSRFRNAVEFDSIVVRCFESDHKVSTYRVTSLSEKYHKLRIDMLRRSLIQTDPRSIDTLYKENRSPGLDKGVAAEQDLDVDLLKGSQHPQAKMNVGVRQTDRLQNLMNKADKAKNKIDQRKKEWKDLYSSRPDDNYEDPNDVAAIKEAQENMGDFKLKTAADYTVPEHLRINAEKKRNQLIRLEELIHEFKVEMSSKIVNLRDAKIDIIEQITSLTEELRSIQTKLDPSQHLPIPIVPSLYPDEMPEKLFQIDQEKMLEFKERSSIKKRKRMSEQLNEFGKSETANTSTASSIQQLEHNSLKSPALEIVKPSQLEDEIEIIEEKTNLYLQTAVLNKISDLIKNFDAELRVICHLKCKLDIAIKMSDLRHVTLFEEVLLLKEFEKSEDILQERVNQRITERLETQIRSEECLQQLESKKRDVAKHQEKEKALHATFLMSLGENNRHADFLTRVFKKKIKRRRKSEAKISAESDEESEEESDEESGYSDEDESDADDGGVDDSACPETCDPALFENTLQLREKRLDIEEALAEEKKSVELLKKEYDMIAKKVKLIEGTVKSAKKDLEVLQREKQQKLNELYVVVPLKLHQVEYIVNGDMPNDLVLGLIFTNPALMLLQKRIKELQVEKDEQRELYKQARQKHVQLLRDKAGMEAEIAELEDVCYQEMIRKFGRVVDLEALQTLSVNMTLEELKEKIGGNETRFKRRVKRNDEKILELQAELTDFTRQYTCRLDQMNAMTVEKRKIETQLNGQQKKMGVELQKQKAKLEEKQDLIQLVERQAKEINKLKDDISLLTRKGGHILPPSQPPLP